MMVHKDSYTQGDEQNHTLYYLSLDSYTIGEQDSEHILDERFFLTKKEALTYGKTYVNQIIDELTLRPYLNEPVEVSYDTIQVSMDDFWCKVVVGELDRESGTEASKTLDKENRLYYLTSFTTNYYIEDEEVIEPGEMRFKHVVDGKLFCNYERVVDYLVKLMMDIEKDQACHLEFESDCLSLYGLQDEETGFEYRVKIETISSNQIRNLIGAQGLCGKVSDESLMYTTKDLKKLVKIYQNRDTYERLSPCKYEFDLHF